MKNEEKIRELAYKRFPENISYSTIIDQHKDYNLHDRNIFIEGAEQMANYKDRQFEDKIRHILNTSFYVNSYNENIVCSDCFEFDGSFSDFVESFIKKLKEINV